MKRVFGFAGWSGSGKTTLIERLIPVFTRSGLRVSLVKHAHHEFDLDQPGKDSFRHRQAGCMEVLVTSSRRWAMIHELRSQPELSLEEALERLSPCDLTLVEGFKSSPIPKLEVYRPALHKPPLFESDAHIVAVASDEPVETALPRLDLNDPDKVATFIMGFVAISPPFD